MLNPVHLRTVVDAGSFAAAARTLGCTTPWSRPARSSRAST
ncbi:MAG: hypothetical protein ABWY11_08185 [Umezawaea sp.]